MKKTNHAVIPRNELVEDALADTDMDGTLDTMYKLLEVLKESYRYTSHQEKYSNLPDKPDEGYKTYCGT